MIIRRYECSSGGSGLLTHKPGLMLRHDFPFDTFYVHLHYLPYMNRALTADQSCGAAISFGNTCSIGTFRIFQIRGRFAPLPFTGVQNARHRNMRVNNSRYCALLVACILGMGSSYIRTKHESMQVNLKPRLDSPKSTKHECSYAGK